MGRSPLAVSVDTSAVLAHFDIDHSKRVGMQVVKALVRRLNAKLNVSSGPGRTVFQINSEP